MLTFAAMSEAAEENQKTNDLPEISIGDLSENLAQAVAKVGWDKLMPVQSRAIPYVLAGRDVMVQARTGSGKTGAFVLPMLDRIDPRNKACQALVLVPTRELAKQVGDQAELLGKSAGLNVVAVYGGVKYGGQLDAFRKGAQVVVGTPGRVLDHLMRGTLNLDALRMLVFDEADRMLSMGFYPDMVRVKGYLPRRRVHSSMFSATFPHHVLTLANQFLHEPETLSLSEDHIHVTEVEHLYYDVPALKKDRCLVRLIEIDNPQSAIIFCNRKQTVSYVAAVLQNFGYDADALSADLSQGARERVLQRVRDGKLKFLVATDVAARGLDIPALSHVYQYEPPEDPEAYIHRAGRTGRAGASGVAITLVSGAGADGDQAPLRAVQGEHRPEYDSHRGRGVGTRRGTRGRPPRGAPARGGFAQAGTAAALHPARAEPELRRRRGGADRPPGGRLLSEGASSSPGRRRARAA